MPYGFVIPYNSKMSRLPGSVDEDESTDNDYVDGMHEEKISEPFDYNNYFRVNIPLWSLSLR